MDNDEQGLMENIIYFTVMTLEKTPSVKRSSKLVSSSLFLLLFCFISSIKENDKRMENIDKRGIKPTILGDIALVS